VIRSERTDKIEIARAANAGHFRAKGFCNLHCESAYAAGRAVDQNFLPCLDMSLVAQTLQGSDSGHADRSCLFECDVGGLHCYGSIGARANILRQRAIAPAEHFVAGFEACNVFTNCLNCSRIIYA
jgi:hypothetical protein